MAQLNIYLNRLEHNLNFLKSISPDKNSLIGVVKANAYGHGIIEISKKLVSMGVSRLSVASVSEGKLLRENDINCNIIVYYPDPFELNDIINYSLEPAIYSKRILKKLIKLLDKSKRDFSVHLKFNTGLNRLGFKFEDIEWLIKKIDKARLRVLSVYSHLSASEDKKNNLNTKKQLKIFNEIKSKFYDLNSEIKYHLLNSSGIFNYPEHQYDWVRSGISLYGYSNNSDWDKNLLPVAELKTKIIQIHNVKKGESVGYNNGWIAKKKSKIAIIPIGHADGIGRYFKNRNVTVKINQLKAPIIGNICMDIFMIDVSHIQCKEWDEVVIFDQKNPANIFAESAGTISYEILSSLGNRIKRVYIS
tara:strand:- start:8348 stop:9430 length:1083 start_codon:yes stop_codon:yes gene_type:complete